MRVIITNRVTEKMIADYTLPDNEPVCVDLNLPATPNTMSPDLLLRVHVFPSGTEAKL